MNEPYSRLGMQMFMIPFEFNRILNETSKVAINSTYSLPARGRTPPWRNAINGKGHA